MADIVLLSLLIFAAAMLYSSVGHAGASGYLAAMALVGVAPDVMKPSALALNILVATITTIRFYKAGCFSWPIFWPFAVSSIPFAFVGGYITLPSSVYKQLVGVALLLAALRLVWNRQAAVQDDKPPTDKKPIPLMPALSCGAGIGLLSGLTGVGGGIYLTPLLLFMGWAETKESAGVSAAFILVNSIAAIFGHLANMNTLPPAIPYWAAAAVVGGIIGSGFGSRRLGNLTLRRLLAVVLVIAGVKLFLV
jgi:uncharacterized membrane protein YfcA